MMKMITVTYHAEKKNEMIEDCINVTIKEKDAELIINEFDTECKAYKKLTKAVQALSAAQGYVECKTRICDVRYRKVD